jgi:ketosteroid isomerase-like protein
MNTITKTADAEIRAVLDAIDAAFQARDANAVMAHYDKNAEIFDLAPPLKSAIGTDTEKLQAWIETWEGPSKREVVDLVVNASGDLAICHCLIGTTVQSREYKREVTYWIRSTIALARHDGVWKIIHRHESVPFHMDGSFKAAVDLTPVDRAA